MPDRMDTEQVLAEMQAIRARLRLDCIAYIKIELRLLDLLGAAGISSLPYRKAHILQTAVLQPLAAGNYAKAHQELDDFLNEWPMYRIMRLLVNIVKPALRAIVESESVAAKLRGLP